MKFINTFFHKTLKVKRNFKYCINMFYKYCQSKTLSGNYIKDYQNPTTDDIKWFFVV